MKARPQVSDRTINSRKADDSLLYRSRRIQFATPNQWDVDGLIKDIRDKLNDGGDYGEAEVVAVIDHLLQRLKESEAAGE